MQLRAKLALCADAMHRHRLVPRYPRRDDSAFVAFILPFSLFSLSLFIYLSWSFIHWGIAPTCSYKRFARDIQSMTTYVLWNSLATVDPQCGSHVYQLYRLYYHILCNLKNQILRCMKGMHRERFKLIPLPLKGINRFLLLYQRRKNSKAFLNCVNN